MFHDLLCVNCNIVNTDVSLTIDQLSSLPACPACGGETQIYFGGWSEVQLLNDGKGDTRTDKQGRIRKFSALDDSLAKTELGMYSRPHDATLRTFTDDQVIQYRERLAVEGDSPKLRQQILETRQKNLGATT